MTLLETHFFLSPADVAYAVDPIVQFGLLRWL